MDHCPPTAADFAASAAHSAQGAAADVAKKLAQLEQRLFASEQREIERQVAEVFVCLLRVYGDALSVTIRKGPKNVLLTGIDMHPYRDVLLSADGKMTLTLHPDRLGISRPVAFDAMAAARHLSPESAVGETAQP